MSATTDVAEPHVTTAQAPAGAARRGLDLGRFRDLSLIPAILVLGVIGFIVSPAFLTADNLIGVAQQSTELSRLVLATALILIALAHQSVRGQRAVPKQAVRPADASPTPKAAGGE